MTFEGVHISQVKTAKKVGEFVLEAGRLNFRYKEDVIHEARLNQPRVYLITVDEIIYKIGGSESRGGIRSTISLYLRGRSGSPGPSRFVTYGLIVIELERGRKVELYMISSPGVKMKVCGLFDCDAEEEAYPFRAMERRCLEDYKALTGKFPPWNFKELNISYPEDLYEEYLRYHSERIKRRSNGE